MNNEIYFVKDHYCPLCSGRLILSIAKFNRDPYVLCEDCEMELNSVFDAIDEISFSKNCAVQRGQHVFSRYLSDEDIKEFPQLSKYIVESNV